MSRLLIILLLSGILVACNDNNTSSTASSILETGLTEEYASEIYFTDSLGWGYRILNNGKLFINQPHIPAVSGLKGFDSEEDAQTTANLALDKIKNGIVPPTISMQELDSLGVRY